MKKLIILFAILIVIIRCTKESVATDPQPGPILISTFFRAYAGSNQSVGFSVALSANAQKLTVYKYPNLPRYTLINPHAGMDTLYDHVGDYPTGPANAWYYFELTTTSGQVITFDKFQVY